MLQIRRAEERGHFDHGWLNTYHTFSFGQYHDPAHMGFRALRVMNEDRVRAGRGFGSHPHEDMEIISYVLEGALEHKDSMGNGSVLRAGDLQRMSAGTGVVHSEFNPSVSEDAHFYQVWLLPDRTGIAPSYAELHGTGAEPKGKLRIVASPDGRDGSLSVHQDVTVHLGALDANDAVTHDVPEDRHVWVQVLRGSARVNDHSLEAGDGIAGSGEPRLVIVAAEDVGAEVMVFDLA